MPQDRADSCLVRRGTGRVLLVAPHGGRRPAVDPLAPPANLRVNDVYTPEVTLALAERLGAGAIINHCIDRNHVDLNRATQVRRQAPWFLDLLQREIAAILARHERAEVVFVHGWNNGQLKCDIGIGGREIAGEIVAPEGRVLSVRPEYLAQRVHAFRQACLRRGIRAPIGEKYPASHPNNLVQLFASQEQAAEIGFRGAERVDAVQIELALPLRCPGAWRERFLDAVVEAFAPTPHRPRENTTLEPAAEADPGAAAGPESLQFYDAKAGIGIFAGLGRMGPKSVGGRLLVFLGGQRIALFTGEEPGSTAVPPLHFTRRGKHVALRFHGPILVLEDAADYLDLEAALAGSTAVAADVAIDFDEIGRAAGSATMGNARGTIAIDGDRREIATLGFGHVAGLRAGAAGQTMLAAAFASERALVTRVPHDEGETSAVWFERDATEQLADVRLRVIEDGDAYTPAAFEFHAPARGLLRGTPLNRMAILRSGPGGYVRVAFGVAHFAWQGLDGFGIYEHALPLAPTRS